MIHAHDNYIEWAGCDECNPDLGMYLKDSMIKFGKRNGYKKLQEFFEDFFSELTGEEHFLYTRSDIEMMGNEVLCINCEKPVKGDWNGEDEPKCLDCQIQSAEDEKDNYYNQDGRN